MPMPGQAAAAHRPGRATAAPAHRTGAAREVFDVGEGPPSRRAATMRCAASSARPPTRSRPRRTGTRRNPHRRVQPFQHRLHLAQSHVDRPHLDAVRARIAHQLRPARRTQRLAVQQRDEEDIGVVALDPAARVGSSAKPAAWLSGSRIRRSPPSGGRCARRSRARSPSRPCGRPGARGMARARPCVSRPPWRGAAHRPRRGEVGGDHRDLHHLLLEDRHASVRCSAGRSAFG